MFWQEFIPKRDKTPATACLDSGQKTENLEDTLFFDVPFWDTLNCDTDFLPSLRRYFLQNIP